MKSIKESLKKLNTLLELAPNPGMRNKPSIYQSNPAQGSLTTDRMFTGTTRDQGQNVQGDIIRVAGAKTQEMIVAFFQQMDRVDAASNETSEHTADVVVNVTFVDDDGQLNLLNTITTTLEVPPELAASTLEFGIEAKKGAGDFDGKDIQKKPELFAHKLNENAGFVIEHPTNESFLFCYLDNSKGRDLKKIMEFHGVDDYAMVNANELWPVAKDDKRDFKVMQADGTEKTEKRAVKRVEYKALETVITSKNPNSKILKFIGDQRVLNSMMKVRVNEKELKRQYQKDRRKRLVENLVTLGVSGVTEDIIEQMQTSYNQYGIPLFCTQLNITSKSGYSGLPEILPLHRITQANIAEDLISKTIYNDLLIKPSKRNNNNPLLGDLVFFERSGAKFVHIPMKSMIGKMPAKTGRGEEFEGVLDPKLPAASSLGKYKRGLERLNKLYDVLLNEGILQNLIEVNNIGTTADGERYVQAANWEKAFGKGTAELPDRLEITNIDVPSDPEQFAPSEAETREAIQLMDNLEQSRLSSSEDFLDASSDQREFANNVESLAAEDESWLADQLEQEDQNEYQQRMSGYRQKLSQNINTQLANLGSEKNEWDAMQQILSDAGITGKTQQNKLMKDLKDDESLSLELKKAYNAWLSSRGGRGGNPFVLPESLRRRFHGILLSEKYSISRILL